MTHITLVQDGPVQTLTLNRPEVHNALNDEVMVELTRAFRAAGEDPNTRVVLLKGEGRSFCAGADIGYMRSQGGKTFLENVDSGREMAALFHAMADCPRPIVAVVQGAALGGGAGIVCASDIAIGHPRAKIGFSEVRLGIVAAVIAPFVELRLGRSEARHLCLTGRRIQGEEALQRGLFHFLSEDLEGTTRQVVDDLLAGSPQAQAATKRLFQRLPRTADKDLLEWTATETALARGSEDGQEGLAAFLEKRKPSWAN